MVYEGWEIPAAFNSSGSETAMVRRGAGISDVSWLAKFDLKGRSLVGDPAPGDGATCWPLGSGHYLITCDPSAQDEVLRRIPNLSSVSCTVVTSVYAGFLLAGPASRSVLRKLTSLDVSPDALADGRCAQSSMAHVNGLLLRQDLSGLAAFILLVSREYGESAWDAILEAGREFNLERFGWEAHRALRG